MKKKYIELEDELMLINENYIKSLGEIKYKKYTYILERILNNEYSWFIRFTLNDNLKDTSNIVPLVDQIVQLSIEYITKGIETPIKDHECKFKISDFINKYEEYMNYIDSFNYKIKG